MAIEDCEFKKSSFPVDGQIYRRCRFDTCTLQFSGGDLPIFDTCTFNNTNFAFTGAAGNTLLFLGSMYKSGGFKTIVEETFKNITGNPDLFKGGA